MYRQKQYKTLPEGHIWDIKYWSARCSKCDFICYKILMTSNDFDFYWESGTHLDEIISCQEYIYYIKMHSALE